MLLSMVLWLIAASLYSYYLNFSDYTRFYAGLSQLMVAMIFFQMTAVIVILGAELNRGILEFKKLTNGKNGNDAHLVAGRGRIRTAASMLAVTQPYRAADRYRLCIRWLASITSSKVRRPVVGAETSTAMLPGLCSLRYMRMCALGICAQGKTSDMHGSMRRSTTSLLAWAACMRLAKCEPCTRFWCIHR